jgi:recombinational DNA repair protein (RecF pathway)
MRFQLSLLRAVGSQPRFDACVCCGRADNLTHFSAFEGGVVCAQCEPRLTEKRRVSRPTLLSLQRHDEANPSGPFNLLNYYISHLSGRAPLLAATLARVVRRPAPGS